MSATKNIPTTELVIGNIVHFHNARFEIVQIKFVNMRRMHDEPNELNDHVIQADGKWIDGDIISGYFGPNKNWNFQANHYGRVAIEV